jgi:hypothetical protein
MRIVNGDGSYFARDFRYDSHATNAPDGKTCAVWVVIGAP